MVLKHTGSRLVVTVKSRIMLCYDDKTKTVCVKNVHHKQKVQNHIRQNIVSKFGQLSQMLNFYSLLTRLGTVGCELHMFEHFQLLYNQKLCRILNAW